MSYVEDRRAERYSLEHKLLSSIMTKNSTAFDILEKQGFNADCFEDPRARAMYQSLKQFYDSGDRIVFEVLPDPEFVDYLKDLKVDANGVKFLAEKVWNMKVSKEIENLFLNGSQYVDRDNRKVIAMMEEFIDKYNESIYSQEKVHSLSDCYKASKEYQEDDSAIGIDPPIKGINDILGNGELILIGARPSTGKTATAISMIASLSRGKDFKNILFYSLEQGYLQVYHRLMSNLTGISHGIIKNKRMSTGQLKKYLDFGDGLRRKGNLYICDAPATKATLEYIEAVSKARHRKGKLDIIFIDYIQLMRSRKNFPSRKDELSYISAQLKSLAKELNIPIVILAQLNRDADSTVKKGESKLPQLKHIKDCGSIEQDIDQAYLLYREFKDDDKMTIIHAKNRDGDAGGVHVVSFELHTQIVGGKFYGQ